jgi:phage terminase large subunit-like protein
LNDTAWCLKANLSASHLKLMKFQRDFIKGIYDNKHGTSRAYLSVARKNGKSALIAGIVLAHIIGPEARLNSQIVSGARSREQASLVFKLAEKMIRLSPELYKLIKIVPSSKMLIGLPMNVEYKAISAEAGTAHGLSPVLAILDEVGQVRGPTDSFIEAIETAQGAHDDPLLIAISTQAATDGDLFSIWLDDAKNAKDRRIVSHVYTAPEKLRHDGS